MKVFFRIIRFCIIPTVIVTVSLIMSSVVSEINSDKIEHDKEKLYESLNRAAVACYTVEGAYPPDIDYLIENYRVHVDKTRYTVMYEYYGSNLKPSITVLENEKD